MASRSLLFALFLSALLATASAAAAAGGGHDDGDDDDLSFLDDGEDEDLPAGDEYGDEEYGDGSYSDLEDFDPSGEEEDPADPDVPVVDEKDVAVLTASNFTSFITDNRHVLVEFYAPWCVHCQALVPEYAAAATELVDEEVKLAKVDATEEDELTQRFKVQGFPTVLFFMDGAHKPYPGGRTKEAIVTWVKKKIRPAIQNVSTVDEAEKILAAESKIVLGFLESLEGPDSRELGFASTLEVDVSFYQTVSPDVAELFHIDPKAKRPSLVMLKREEEKLAYFDGEFTKTDIGDFVFANKLPLVTTFTRESATLIFDNPIKKQLLLFATSKDSEKVLPVFKDAARVFKGKLIFVYVELDNEDLGMPVSEYFGITGDEPQVLGYTGNEDGRKFVLDDKVTFDSIKRHAYGVFGEKEM